MRTASLARKPLSEGNVAQNVLHWGSGALHIDPCRIEHDGTGRWNNKDSIKNWKSMPGNHGQTMNKGWANTGSQRNPHGRWPANLILAHLPGCRKIGTSRVKSSTSFPASRGKGGVSTSGHRGQTELPAYTIKEETVDAWVCESRCPVLYLDTQSGESKSPSTPIKQGGFRGGFDVAMCAGGPREGFGVGYGDVGGASRYFFTVQESAMTNVPQDMLNYLHTMITPEDGETLIALDLSTVDWSSYKDNQLHGIIAQGNPTPYLDDIWRVLRPGAHVMLIAPEEQPTGHTGTCALEDRGFEIRDAILWAREAGGLHYVPKASTRERNAGCGDISERMKKVVLELRSGYGDDKVSEILEGLVEAGISQDVIDAIDEVGIDRDLVPDTLREYFQVRSGNARSHGNSHPCVKPRDVLVRLLSDIPEGATVLDPFMGSGSQGIACLKTGHNYIGIEREESYIQIADARIRFWDSEEAGWRASDIQSEAPPLPPLEDMDLDDLFKL